MESCAIVKPCPIARVGIILEKRVVVIKYLRYEADEEKDSNGREW